jgi:hypothetical protein
MPTMPLNQLAFLFEWLALRTVKMDRASFAFVRKHGIPIPLRAAPACGILP